MAAEREERIRQFRVKQPLAELDRKAVKARRRGFWTQEEIDAAKVRAAEMAAWFDAHEKAPCLTPR